MTGNHKDALRRSAESTAALDIYLHLFGDFIAKREKYKALQGVEALHFYIVHKFHWKPSEVIAMKGDDLRFILAEEMSGWTIPPEYR